MTFTDIFEQTIIHPGEQDEQVYERLESAYLDAKNIIIEHMDLSVDPQIYYEYNDPLRFDDIEETHCCHAPKEIVFIQAQVEEMTNKDDVLTKLGGLAISPTTVYVYPNVICVCWELAKPLIVQNRNERSLVRQTIANIFHDLNLEKATLHVMTC